MRCFHFSEGEDCIYYFAGKCMKGDVDFDYNSALCLDFKIKEDDLRNTIVSSQTEK